MAALVGTMEIELLARFSPDREPVQLGTFELPVEALPGSTSSSGVTLVTQLPEALAEALRAAADAIIDRTP